MGGVSEEVVETSKAHLKVRSDLAPALGVNKEVYLEIDSEVGEGRYFKACILGKCLFFKKIHVQSVFLRKRPVGWGGVSEEIFENSKHLVSL